MNAISAFEARLVCQVDAVDHVLLEDPALTSGSSSSWMCAAGLVLDEREPVLELANVVFIGADACPQRIGADRLGRALAGCRPSSVMEVPGVSTRSGEASVDGFVSSGGWKTVRIPNTDPSTANEPDRRDPRAGGRDGRGEVHRSRTRADPTRQ